MRNTLDFPRIVYSPTSMSTQPIVVIPARYGSTRFPGKPLTKVRGRVMIERVWRIACAAVGADNVFVATDDQRIVDGVASFGGQAVMTPAECENGTERVLAAVKSLGRSPEVIVNLQGDALLTPPWFIEALVEEMRRDTTCLYATPAVSVSKDQYNEIVKSKASNPFSGTFVTFDFNWNALYFSKQIIPALRYPPTADLPVYQHIGMYAYRLSSLERYLTLKPGVLERVEGLEQLRVLENSLSMRVVCVDFRGRSAWAIDAPEDVRIVESIIDREGELLGA